MKVEEKNIQASAEKRYKKAKTANTVTAVVMLIAILLVLTAVVLERRSRNIRNGVVGYSGVPIINWIAGTTDYNSTKNWPVGYLSSSETEIEVIGEDGASLGFFPRGT